MSKIKVQVTIDQPHAYSGVCRCVPGSRERLPWLPSSSAWRRKTLEHLLRMWQGT